MQDALYVILWFLIVLEIRTKTIRNLTIYKYLSDLISVDGDPECDGEHSEGGGQREEAVHVHHELQTGQRTAGVIQKMYTLHVPKT